MAYQLSGAVLNDDTTLATQLTYDGHNILGVGQAKHVLSFDHFVSSPQSGIAQFDGTKSNKPILVNISTPQNASHASTYQYSEPSHDQPTKTLYLTIVSILI